MPPTAPPAKAQHATASSGRHPAAALRAPAAPTWLAMMLPCVKSSAMMAGSLTPQLATDSVMRMLRTIGSSHTQCSLAQKPSGTSARVACSCCLLACGKAAVKSLAACRPTADATTGIRLRSLSAERQKSAQTCTSACCRRCARWSTTT